MIKGISCVRTKTGTDHLSSSRRKKTLDTTDDTTFCVFETSSFISKNVETREYEIDWSINVPLSVCMYDVIIRGM